MEFGALTAAETEIGKIEKVELTAERRFRTARAFGHGCEASKVWRKPLDNQAGFGKRACAEDQPGGVFDHLETPEGSTICLSPGCTGTASGRMEPRLTMYLMASATDISSRVTLSSAIMSRNPEDKVTRLEMSVADAIKYIVSLGSILPEAVPVQPGDKQIVLPSGVSR